MHVVSKMHGSGKARFEKQQNGEKKVIMWVYSFPFGQAAELALCGAGMSEQPWTQLRVCRHTRAQNREAFNGRVVAEALAFWSLCPGWFG